MRIYEELFIVRPDATDEEIDPVIEQITSVVAAHGGTVEKTDKWGVRKLAYRVEKRHEGYYVLMQFTAGPDSVKEIERRLRMLDLVMKFITVRIDKKLKKIEKRKKSRDKRAARRPAPVAPPPSMPTGEPAAGGSVPGAPMPGAPMPGAPTSSAAAPPTPTPTPSSDPQAAPPTAPPPAEKEQ